MYRIIKSKSKKFLVVLTANNGEVLSTSEVLNSKAAVWKNLNAIVKGVQSKEGHYIHIQDETLVQPLTTMLWNTGKKDTYKIASSIPVYVKGKNPKKKK